VGSDEIALGPGWPPVAGRVGAVGSGVGRRPIRIARRPFPALAPELWWAASNGGEMRALLSYPPISGRSNLCLPALIHLLA